MAPQSTRHILVSFGTAGDVYPFIGIGSALRRRGHDVILITHERFHKPAADADISTVAVGDEKKYRNALKSRHLWTHRRGLRTIMQRIVPDPLWTYEVLRDLSFEKPSILLSHPFALAPRLLQEKTSIPCATLILSTCLLRSNHRMPVMVEDLELSTMPTPFKALMWALADRLLIDPAVTPVLNRTRRRLGLPEIRRPFDGWIHSPRLAIGLFPKWFAPPQPDWPEQVVLTGFPRFQHSRPVPPEVDDFLDAGPKPLVFTCGSATPDVTRYLPSAIEACHRSNKRGLFVGFTSSWEPARESTRFLFAEFAPFHKILDRCALLVHHGGIGTTAAGLAAGLPHIVRPIAHDHFDHAARVDHLGTGRRLLPRHFDAENLCRAIDELLESRAVAEQCALRARQIDHSDALATTCDLIDDLRRT